MDHSSQLFILVKRGGSLNRALLIWSRGIKKNPSSVQQIFRVRFSAEQGIDSGALAQKVFTKTLPNIASVFSHGQPVDSTFRVQNGNFKSCGKVMVASIAKGGPAPWFLFIYLFLFFLHSSR